MRTRLGVCLVAVLALAFGITYIDLRIIATNCAAEIHEDRDGRRESNGFGVEVGRVLSIDSKEETLNIDFGRSNGAESDMILLIQRQGPAQEIGRQRIAWVMLTTVTNKESSARVIMYEDSNAPIEKGDQALLCNDDHAFEIYKLGNAGHLGSAVKLAQERVKATKRWLSIIGMQYLNSEASIGEYIAASKQLMQAELGVTEERKQRISIINSHLVRVTLAINQERSRPQIDGMRDIHIAEAKCYQIEASILLNEAKQAQKTNH